MSLTFNMVGGGGGKLKGTDAVLVVTVPTGSTVTATKGGATLTPTMWVKAADATLDCAIFSISASQFDSTTPWTITATNGVNTASDTVLITTNKEYEVTLVCELRIITAGARDQSVGIILQHMAETQGNGFLLYKQSSLQNPEYVSFGPVDISTYSTLNWRMSVAGINTAYANAYGIGQNHGKTLVMYNSMNAIPGQAVNTYTQDISSYTGEYYITAFVEASGNGPQISIYDLWLE